MPFFFKQGGTTQGPHGQGIERSTICGGRNCEAAIAAARYCLKIATCTHIALGGTTIALAFANLKDLAKQNVAVTDLHGLDVHHVTVAHLQQQFAYFEYADNFPIGVIQEGNRQAGRPALPNVGIPPAIPQPPLFV